MLNNNSILILLLSFFIFCCDNNPKINIHNPKNNDVLNKLFKIEINATDNDSIQYVGIIINGDTLDKIDYDEPYIFNLNSIQFDDNPKNKIIAYAYNYDGNSIQSDSITVQIDNSQSFPKQIIIEDIEFMDNQFRIIWESKELSLIHI